MKTFACKDAGVECAWTTTADTEEVVFAQVEQHAHETHGIGDMGNDLVRRIKSAIRDVKVNFSPAETSKKDGQAA